jgi:hypothetical protein
MTSNMVLHQKTPLMYSISFAKWLQAVLFKSTFW